jgi:hypothetical protein
MVISVKRLTLIGILLVVISLGVLYVNSLQIQSGFAPGQLDVMLLAANTIRYASINLTNSTALGTLFYTNSTPIDYYLLNQTGFDAALPYIESNSILYAHANSLEGNGAIAIVHNSTAGEYPYQQGATSNQVQPYSEYESNSSTIVPAGSYYEVFQNTGSRNVTIYYSAIEKTQSQISSGLFSNAAYGFVGAVLFIGGIIAALYSIFLGSRDAKTANEEDIYKAYDALEAKQRRKLQGNGPNTAAGKRGRKGLKHSQAR